MKNVKDSKNFKLTDIITVTDPDYLAKYLLLKRDDFCTQIGLLQGNLYNLTCSLESNFDGVFE